MANRDALEQPSEHCPLDARKTEQANPLDSGLRRKFLAYCEENPGAEECRIYEV